MSVLKMAFAGDKELIKKISTLRASMQKKIVKDGVDAATKFIHLKTRAKARAVLIAGYATNKLSSGIYYKVKKNKKHGVFGMIMTPTREYLGIPTADKYYYPAVLEFGSETYTATSFMRSALKESDQKAIKILQIIVKKGILKRMKTASKKDMAAIRQELSK